jgi:Tfp pilus assembly protein PilE
MFISKAAREPHKKHGVSLLEITTVLVIATLLIGIAWSGWIWRMEQEYALNAKVYLKTIWQAEQNYFSWRDQYTADWGQLELDPVNKTDNKYDYTIIKATDRALTVEARRKTTNKGFSVNETEAINRLE